MVGQSDYVFLFYASCCFIMKLKVTLGGKEIWLASFQGYTLPFPKITDLSPFFSRRTVAQGPNLDQNCSGTRERRFSPLPSMWFCKSKRNSPPPHTVVDPLKEKDRHPPIEDFTGLEIDMQNEDRKEEILCRAVFRSKDHPHFQSFT